MVKHYTYRFHRILWENELGRLVMTGDEMIRVSSIQGVKSIRKTSEVIPIITKVLTSKNNNTITKKKYVMYCTITMSVFAVYYLKLKYYLQEILNFIFMLISY